MGARHSRLLGAGVLLLLGGWWAGCGFDGEATAISPAEAPRDGGSLDAPTLEEVGPPESNVGDGAVDTSPFSLPSLLLWLDGSDVAGDGTAPADGASMASWVDKAKGRLVAQSAAARQPTFRASGISGRPALRFDGSDDFLDIDLDLNGTVLPDATVLCVFENAPGNPSSFAGVWGHDNGGWDRFIVSGGSYGQSGVSNGTSFTTVPGLTAQGTRVVSTIVMRSNTVNASRAYVNGVLATSFTGSIKPGLTHLSIGNLTGTASFDATRAFDGLIAEVLVYGSALTDPERQAIETALLAKYR